MKNLSNILATIFVTALSCGLSNFVFSNLIVVGDKWETILAMAILIISFTFLNIGIVIMVLSIIWTAP